MCSSVQANSLKRDARGLLLRHFPSENKVSKIDSSQSPPRIEMASSERRFSRGLMISRPSRSLLVTSASACTISHRVSELICSPLRFTTPLAKAQSTKHRRLKYKEPLSDSLHASGFKPAPFYAVCLLMCANTFRSPAGQRQAPVKHSVCFTDGV